MQILLSGDLGFSTDAEEVFADFDAKLLIASAALVLFLLGAIYRAVLVAITPLLVVFFAYSVATAFVYLYAESGATVSSNGTSILIVLMFGITTDYCLLLVSRYREELHRLADKHDAMQRALRAHRADDPRLGADGLAGDADADPRRRPADLDPGAGGGDRGRLRACSPASPCCRRCSRSSAARASGRAPGRSSTTPRRRR